MREGFNVQYELESAIDLLSDMIINYLSIQERKSALRVEVMAWLAPMILAEEEQFTNHLLTAELLGTEDYQLAA
jgi:hypothetical protein